MPVSEVWFKKWRKNFFKKKQQHFGGVFQVTNVWLKSEQWNIFFKQIIFPTPLGKFKSFLRHPIVKVKDRYRSSYNFSEKSLKVEILSKGLFWKKLFIPLSVRRKSDDFLLHNLPIKNIKTHRTDKNPAKVAS